MNSTATRTFALEHVASIDSTSSELLRRAATRSVHRAALTADVQTAGRGQRGRRWFAEAGDAVLLSVGWTFARDVKLDGLSLAIGVAAARALTNYSPDRITLKWPNDVLIEDRAKLAGVLVETLPHEGGGRTAIIGIGVNVRPPHPSNTHQFDPEALPPAALISNVLPRHADGAPIVCNAIRAALLSEFAVTLESFEAQGFQVFRDEWFSRRAFANVPVRVFEPGAASGESFVGRIANVASDGALIIDDGRALHTLHSGAVSLRPA